MGVCEHRYCKSKDDLAWYCSGGDFWKYEKLRHLPKYQLVAIKCRVQRKLKDGERARFY